MLEKIQGVMPPYAELILGDGSRAKIDVKDIIISYVIFIKDI